MPVISRSSTTTTTRSSPSRSRPRAELRRPTCWSNVERRHPSSRAISRELYDLSSREIALELGCRRSTLDQHVGLRSSARGRLLDGDDLVVVVVDDREITGIG